MRADTEGEGGSVTESEEFEFYTKYSFELPRKYAHLFGQRLDDAVAKASGLVRVRVGYFGSDSETPEQRKYEEWLERNQCESVGDYWIDPEGVHWYAARAENKWDDVWSPSTKWEHGGPLIQDFEVMTFRSPDHAPKGDEWGANRGGFVINGCGSDGVCLSFGPTPLIAAMRCIVAAVEFDELWERAEKESSQAA